MSAYTDAVERGLEGLQAVSTGPCPGCETCAENYGFETDEQGMAAFRKAWQSGDVESVASFSWSGCDICGTSLGVDTECWHAIAGKPGDDLKGREILHFQSACVDCVMYLANGDEPEEWRR